jgi:GNAT superfamily N-acetyltransferase
MDHEMTEPVIIRDAVPSDTDGIVALTLAANAPYAQAMGDGWSVYQENVITTLTRASAAQRIVAEYQGVLVGSVLLVPGHERDSGAPEVRLLAVASSMRGQGIGRALMQECLRRVRATEAPVLHLHTMEFMATAKGLYERMGFVRAPAEDFSPVEGMTVLGYQLELMDGSVL